MSPFTSSPKSRNISAQVVFCLMFCRDCRFGVAISETEMLIETLQSAKIANFICIEDFFGGVLRSVQNVSLLNIILQTDILGGIWTECNLLLQFMYWISNELETYRQTDISGFPEFLLRRYEIHMKGRECLFNDALNTFSLRLYGVGYMVKNYSDIERGNPLSLYGLLFSISKGSYMHHPIDMIAHTTTFVTQVVEHWQEQEITHWGTIRRPIAQ